MADFVGLVLLHTAKGRDKFCAFAQNFAKFYSLQHGIGSENHAVYRAMENNISDGRKIFKWFKFFPEAVKSRDAFRRAALARGFNWQRAVWEGTARAVSCIYFFYDNVIWACAVGILRSAKLPGHLRALQKVPEADDGPLVKLLGGSKHLSRRKNVASFYRIIAALICEATFAVQCLRERTAETTSRRILLAHVWEVVALVCNFRVLLKRIYPRHATWGRLSLESVGLLGMLASASAIAKIYCETPPNPAAKLAKQD